MKNVSREEIIVRAPIDDLTHQVDTGQLEGALVNVEKLRKYGVFIVRSYFDKSYLNKLSRCYFELIASGEIKKDLHHRTEVRFSEAHDFARIIEHHKFLQAAKEIFGDSVGLDFMRIIKKDRSNNGPVFLHQDSCYNVGRFEAFSFFIPLSRCSAENGGLEFYPGTHNYGHIGDAGGIANVLPANYPVLSPTVDVGDLIIMHSGTWHSSPPNTSGEPRVYLECAIRHGSDPAAKKILVGEDMREWVLKISVDDLFETSREKRIINLHKQIEKLTAESRGVGLGVV
jgi:Phytanoyl-CoA dioxygenase (PhyH)